MGRKRSGLDCEAERRLSQCSRYFIGWMVVEERSCGDIVIAAIANVVFLTAKQNDACHSVQDANYANGIELWACVRSVLRVPR